MRRRCCRAVRLRSPSQSKRGPDTLQLRGLDAVRGDVQPSHARFWATILSDRSVDGQESLGLLFLVKKSAVLPMFGLWVLWASQFWWYCGTCWRSLLKSVDCLCLVPLQSQVLCLMSPLLVEIWRPCCSGCTHSEKGFIFRVFVRRPKLEKSPKRVSAGVPSQSSSGHETSLATERPHAGQSSQSDFFRAASFRTPSASSTQLVAHNALELHPEHKQTEVYLAKGVGAVFLMCGEEWVAGCSPH